MRDAALNLFIVIARVALRLPGHRLRVEFTGETPDWSVVAGVAARKLRSRPSTAQQRLPPYRRWFH